ncbi:MAG: hypothetical protein C0404_08990 [Verrucomicrobia bacterium]|nr:hypothetical protein [Verrucomicrobiota bacterium]
MPADIAQHCLEIDRCNQRGGRMLSIGDLLDAGTVTIDVAAYALAAIWKGASFMTGALPGGAGKTTVMGALLNFVPPDVELAAADGVAAIAGGMKIIDRRRCYICHEISDGGYYAYLWGAELRAFFQLKRAGHILATNLHADTFEQARAQVCVENGVTPEDFRGMNLIFFISVVRGRGSTTRTVREIWESDGSMPHRQVFSPDNPVPQKLSRLVTVAEQEAAAKRIGELAAGGARTIEQVRGSLLR